MAWDNYMTMPVKGELLYGQVVPTTGLGEINIIGKFSATMEVNETDGQGNVVGRKTVRYVTLIKNDDGVFAVPGDIETQRIPLHELKNIVPKDTYREMQNAMRRNKRRSRNVKTSTG